MPTKPFVKNFKWEDLDSIDIKVHDHNEIHPPIRVLVGPPIKLLPVLNKLKNSKKE